MARETKKKAVAKTKANTQVKAKPKKRAGLVDSKPTPAKKAKTKATKKPARAVKAEVVTPAPPKKKPWIKRWRWAFLKLVIVLVLLACLIPTIFTYIYRSSSVRPVSTLMLSHWVSGASAKRTWVSFDDISPFLIQSVISSEDGKYCNHEGVDWDAVNLVVDDLIEGERPRGASTIPMQTVKNLYLWSSRSYVRKGLEVPLALLVDAVWSKKRLMEIYLNIAEWGPGIFGVEAAARYHFKRSAKSLNRKQAALLAVTLPNPILRNPRKPGKGMRRLARLVERRARQSGAYIKCVR